MQELFQVIIESNLDLRLTIIIWIAIRLIIFIKTSNNIGGSMERFMNTNSIVSAVSNVLENLLRL